MAGRRRPVRHRRRLYRPRRPRPQRRRPRPAPRTEAGLSKVLVAEALADSRERGITVVPICPLFVKKLKQTGDDYQAEGGRFRNATGADFDIVKKQA